MHERAAPRGRSARRHALENEKRHSNDDKCFAAVQIGKVAVIQCCNPWVFGRSARTTTGGDGYAYGGEPGHGGAPDRR